MKDEDIRSNNKFVQMQMVPGRMSMSPSMYQRWTLSVEADTLIPKGIEQVTAERMYLLSNYMI